MISNRTAREIAGTRIGQWRRRRAMTAEQLATRCAELGAEQMTRNLVANTESHRRGLTVDDLLVYALALNVSPLMLLTPENGEALAITAPVTVESPDQVGAWLRGDAALPQSDARLYYGAALEGMAAPSGEPLSAYARAVIQERAAVTAAQYEQEFLALLDRERGKARRLVDDIRTALVTGADTPTILARLDDIRRRLELPITDVDQP